MGETGERMKIGVMPSLGENDYGAEAPNGRTPRFSDIKAMAQLAEDVGVDSFWLADHLLYKTPDTPVSGQWEVFTFMSGVAAVTKRIQIGPLVACTSFRNPALLAKMADALDEISDGRFILGLGAGWHQPEYDAFGYPFDHKASRFEEALKIILPLLKEGKVDFKGEYYEARECLIDAEVRFDCRGLVSVDHRGVEVDVQVGEVTEAREGLGKRLRRQIDADLRLRSERYETQKKRSD